jgi:hypothetical protein
MQGSFACPECGYEIRPTGLAPGRQVRCGWCDSLVEVPFFPRADQIMRSRSARRRGRSAWWAWRSWPVWARLTVPLLCVAVAVALAYRVVRSRWQSADAAALVEMVETSLRAEKAGRLGDALTELQSALARAERMAPPPPGIDDLRRRRDALSLREAEAKLAALSGPVADPGSAVGQVLTLRARAARDPALADLATAIEAALERLRQTWAQADSVEAAKALEAGRPDRAMDLCERLHRTADELPAEPRHRLQDEAAAIARRIIARYGTIVEPVRGQFTLGTPDSYTTQLRPIFLEGLRNHGYLPRPAQPVWPDLWTEAAPFRIVFEVVERQDESYLQSPNRISQIDGKMEMVRGGKAFWHDTPSARTQVPVPALPAYQASRVAVSAHRSPDFERVLYNNARAGLLERIGLSIRNLPPCPDSGPVPALHASSLAG